MSKISRVVKQQKNDGNAVINFMGGTSYKFNPLDTLKMISASSIFAEPQYYRDSGVKDKGYLVQDAYLRKECIFDIEAGTTASELMIKAVNDALDYDFGATLDWAKELRYDYYMRLNPQLIMVLAAVHPKRKEYTEKFPGAFNSLNSLIMRRADEPSAQFSLYLYLNGGKTKIPSILKRSWKYRIENMSRYEIAKYKNAECGLIDTVRVCHANNSSIDELMKNGTIEVSKEEETWEKLRSAGKSFKEILNTIKLPHMALLRNLRNIFSELDEDTDKELANNILNQLIDGVKGGKQFPFRYLQALNQLKKSEVKFKTLLIDKLEECIDVSIDSMPKLKGRTACLSDNSGSAWGTFNSEYGTMTVAQIGNLSSIITCKCSEDGEVFAFGDELISYPVSKRNGALIQANDMSKDARINVGGGTENGVWLFFKNAIEKNIKYDNIFIYSDIQAGHGGLFGKDDAYIIDGKNFALRSNGYANEYIDVLALVKAYRAQVNSKVNIFSVQTAGYDNVLIPEYLYRGALLYGWTGKESVFASELIKQWNEIENATL